MNSESRDDSNSESLNEEIPLKSRRTKHQKQRTGKVQAETGNAINEDNKREKNEKCRDKDKFNKDYSQMTLETSAAEVEERLKGGCECKVSCFEGFDPESIYKHRLNVAELTKNEQDFYLMGIVRACLMDTSDRGVKRQRKRSSYTYYGRKVCLFAFLYLENTTIYQLKKIRSHVMKHGVVAIQHGNSHKIPHNAFSLDLYKRVENFLRGYLKTEKHLSGKSIVLNHPLSQVYKQYREFDKDSKQFMGFSTFRTFFKKQFPHVRLSTSKLQASSSHKQHQIAEEIIKDDDFIPDDLGYSNTDDLIYYDEEISHEEEIECKVEF